MAIRNIIFDFGDVFINLDKDYIYDQMEYAHLDKSVQKNLLKELNEPYEVGDIDTDAFLAGLFAVYPDKSKDQIKDIWNGMLLDFPVYRLEFLKELSQSNTYRLFLLSNTNSLHINNVYQVVGSKFYTAFKGCFEQFYLSHEIGLRKPDAAVFHYVLEQNDLKAIETLFIDDTIENIKAAAGLSIQTWHLTKDEDVVELKNWLDEKGF